MKCVGEETCFFPTLMAFGHHAFKRDAHEDSDDMHESST